MRHVDATPFDSLLGLLRVWPALVELQRKELLGSSLLGIYGIWQCASNVRHLIAKRLVDLSPLLRRLSTNSRDFG
jgi:error-prone DNA polymerase